MQDDIDRDKLIRVHDYLLLRKMQREQKRNAARLDRMQRDVGQAWRLIRVIFLLTILAMTITVVMAVWFTLPQ